MNQEIELGRLAAERQRQALMILNESPESPKTYGDICSAMVPRGSLIENDLSEIEYYGLIISVDTGIGHRFYGITNKGKEFVDTNFKEKNDAKDE